MPGELGQPGPVQSDCLGQESLAVPADGGGDGRDGGVGGPAPLLQSGRHALLAPVDQRGPLSLVEECRGSALIGREFPQ